MDVYGINNSLRVTIGNNLDKCLFDRAESYCLGNYWNPLLNENLNNNIHSTTSDIWTVW